MTLRAFSVAIILLCAACGDESGESTGSGGQGGGDACAAGEVSIGGACLRTGVPPEACGPGFVPLDEGCAAEVPECEDGQIAWLGETSCHDFAPCDGSPWGNAPDEPTTQYVDAAFTGGTGTKDAPWSTIADAMAAAQTGAAIAIARGSYDEDIWPLKTLRLHGACAREVILSGAVMQPSTVVLQWPGSELHDVTIDSPSDGVSLAGIDIVMENVWVRSDKIGVVLIDAFGPANMLVRNTVVDGAGVTGMFIAGAVVAAENVIVRNATAGNVAMSGAGVAITTNPMDGLASSVSFTHAIVERAEAAGFSVEGSALTLDDVLIRHIASPANVDGVGVVATRSAVSGASSELHCNRLVIEDVVTGGVVLQGGSASLSNTTIRDTRASAPMVANGSSLVVQQSGGNPASVVVADSTFERADMAGVLLLDSTATINGLVMRGVRGGPESLFGDGIVAVSFDITASATIQRGLLENNLRAGVSAFAANLVIGETILNCNAFHIAAEPHNGVEAIVTDAQGNMCGCAATGPTGGSDEEPLTPTCKAVSVGIAPPSPAF